jgi:hypothetical protein
MTATLKTHLLWKSPFLASSSNYSSIRQLHNTDIVLASSLPLGVLEFYRTLIAAANTAEIDLARVSSFDPDHALWTHKCCADIIFEINDALALCLGQTGTLNLDDTFLIIPAVLAYVFLHSLLKKAKSKSTQ